MVTTIFIRFIFKSLSAQCTQYRLSFNKEKIMLGKLITIALFIISINAQAVEVERLDPYQLIDKVATQTLQRIQADKQKIETNSAHIQTIVREELMPFVDHRLASKLILESTKVDKATRKNFYVAFEEHLVKTYAAIFNNYDGQQLELDRSRAVSNVLQFTVKGVLKNKQKEDLNLAFKLRYNAKKAQWKMYDLVVEGVSMLNSKKAELKPLIRQQNGVEMAIVALNSKKSTTP